ncbi:hypothetical protein MPL3365_140152 [Mesorhizobium plurifarium]|uniref:Uncharacterized protein n=1 Tax=Mesorhizobium plurifarium TaxID=69974 RepID=A0A090FXH6_MESPL|nr:hypothetical protein MPL3365_140152 [Mesorhizobium plurifarium]
MQPSTQGSGTPERRSSAFVRKSLGRGPNPWPRASCSTAWKAWRNSSLNAAPTFASGVAGAGSSFGKSVAVAFIAGVSGFLYSGKADPDAPRRQRFVSPAAW